MAALLFASAVHAAVFGVPTPLNADGTVPAGAVNPPGWFVLTGPTAANSLGDTVHQLRLFIEVEDRGVIGTADETLDIRVFDPGASGARDGAGTAASTTRYRVFPPTGATLVNFTIADDAAPPTQNRLARLSSTGAFTAANAGSAFTNRAAGLYELRITVESGDETNAFGVEVTDGAGRHYNAYTVGSSNTPDTAFVAGTVTGPTAPSAGTIAPIVLFPYVAQGCSIATSNYDLDANTTAGAGATAAIRDALGATTALAASGNQLHLENTVTVEPTTTLNLQSTNYGIWTLTNGPGTDDNRAVEWRIANFQGWNTNPLALPRDPAQPVRMYLPNGYSPSSGDAGATAPAEPYLATGFAVVSGANPPQAGLLTRYLVTASVSNPTASAIGDVTVTIPLMTGATFVSSSATPACTTEVAGATYRSCTFATIAASAIASYSITVDDTPALGFAGLRNLTGMPTTRSAQVVGGQLTYNGGTGLASANTTAAHGLQTGDYVTISGAVQAEYNGLYQVTVVDGNTFTYTPTTAPTVSPATGEAIFATLPGCLTTTNGPVCATYTPAFSSVSYGRSETLGPVCPLSVFVAPVNVNLRLTKAAAPSPVTAGQDLTYTITATNPAGSGTAVNVAMVDPLPVNTTFRSIVVPSGWSCTTPPVGTRGTASCSAPSMAANTTAGFTIVVNVDSTATGSVVNTATVSSLGSDADPSDNSSTSTVAINAPAGEADLAITKADRPDPVVAGRDITYTLTIRNNGPAPAATPVFADATPANTTFRAIALPSGWSCSALPAVGGTGPMTCTAPGAMASGASVRILLSVRVNLGATGNVTNVATVLSTTTDTVPGNNAASATTAIGPAPAAPTCGPTTSPTIPLGTWVEGGTLTGVINTYYPATDDADLGDTSITLGTATGATTPISAGDLLLVIQMQDAQADWTNTSSYGDGVPADPGSGYLDPRGTGRYEFVRASNNVGLAGGTLNLTTGLVNDYTDAAYNPPGGPTWGQRRFQVVRVPQYTTATLSSSLTAGPWDGRSGGILALDVANALDLGGATVDVSSEGFRGGGGRGLGGDGGPDDDDYRSLATDNCHAPKGEGIAGTPRYMWDETQNLLIDTTVEGYPFGSHARGAPGNAGGGGSDGNPAANDQNSGGGGGGNGGAGGKGGNAWNSQDPYGGWGGATLFNPLNPQTPMEIVLGGGGGAGTRNNSSGIESSGGTGGGIILLRAGSVTGTGTLVANGSDGHDAGRDGGGGGGAGGTIVVSTTSGELSGLAAVARGGDGGDSWRTQAPNGIPGERHGPGGGGGGGIVWLSAAGSSVDVSGGTRGITTTALDPYGATSGSPGVSGVVQPSQIPGLDSGAECSADVAILKTSSPQTPTGADATYDLLVTNNGFRQATNVTVTDTLPAGTTYVSSTASQGGPCVYVAPVLTCNIGSLDSGASALVTVVVSSVGGEAPTNTGRVTRDQYDPIVTNDSSTVGAPADLAVTLGGAPDPVAAGATLRYTATVSNNGPSDATNAVLTFPIPPSTTFASISPPPGWTCVAPVPGGTGTIRCSRSTDMPVGGAETFVIDAYVSASALPNTLIPATATVSSANDAVLANNSATIENNVIPSIVLITRTHIRGVRFDPGSGLVEFATGWQRQTRSFDLFATPGENPPAEGEPSLNESPIRAPRPDSLTPTLYRVELPPFRTPYLWIAEKEAGGRRFLMGPYRTGDRRLADAYARLEERAARAGARSLALEGGASAQILPPAAALHPKSILRQSVRGSAWARPHRVSGEGLRVEVRGPGEVRLTRAELEAAGLPPRWALRLLNVTLAGRGVPSRVVDAGGAGETLVFDAVALKTVYSGRAQYILSWRGRPSLRVPLTREGDPEWLGWLRVEKSWLYVPSVPLGTDPWLWDAAGLDGPTWPSWDPTAGDFDLPPLPPGAETVPVRLRLIGYGPYRHEIEAAVNGWPVGSVAIEGTQAGMIVGSVPRSVLKEARNGDGPNQLTLSYSSDAPEAGLGWVYVDHLDFRVPPDPTVKMAVPHQVFPFDPAVDLPSDCDYLIVTHPRFADEARRLAARKGDAGYRTAVVDVERAYDYFSAGIVEAEAVRAVIRQAARGGQLRHVLLFGDDTFDYRDDAATGAVSYVPSLYGWDGEFGRVPSETRYADVDGDGSPDVAIGRLPAQDETEAKVLVDKIERQEATLAGSAGRHLFVVDRDDPTPGMPSFAGEARAVAARLGTGAFTWADANVDPTAARQVLFDALGAGMALTHVFAHGAPWQWGSTALLTVDDVQGPGGGEPPLGDGPETVVLTWACESQLYTYLWGDTINEALMLKPVGGAAAAFGPVGISDLAVQATLYERLYAELPRADSLGEAIRRAKAAALAEDPRAWAVVEGWNLLGDPSLPMGAAFPSAE